MRDRPARWGLTMPAVAPGMHVMHEIFVIYFVNNIR